MFNMNFLDIIKKLSELFDFVVTITFEDAKVVDFKVAMKGGVEYEKALSSQGS